METQLVKNVDNAYAAEQRYWAAEVSPAGAALERADETLSQLYENRR